MIRLIGLTFIAGCGVVMIVQSAWWLTHIEPTHTYPAGLFPGWLGLVLGTVVLGVIAAKCLS